VVKVKLPGLKVYRVKGKWYAYVRATGEALIKNFEGDKPALLKMLATPNMIGAYNVKRMRAARSYPEHTLGWLVSWFVECEHFRKLSTATQTRYRECLACLENVYDDQLDDIRTHDIVLARDQVEKDKWPAFGDMMVTALSTMFGLAKERGWMDNNVAKGIRSTYKSDKNANREWTPAEWATVMERAPMHLKIAYMLARHLGYRSQSTVAVTWKNYQPDPRFGMCFRMNHRKNDEEGHWLPASPELQAFLAGIKVHSAEGPIAVRHNGRPWESAEQLQKQSSNFLTKLARNGLVGAGLTEHGLRATFASEFKRVTGANDSQVAAALGDRDVRMGAHYTRHVEQEARIVEVFTKLQRLQGTRTEQDLSKGEEKP
jgi:integrase